MPHLGLSGAHILLLERRCPSCSFQNATLLQDWAARGKGGQSLSVVYHKYKHSLSLVSCHHPWGKSNLSGLGVPTSRAYLLIAPQPHGRGWMSWYSRVPSNPNHSIFLLLCATTAASIRWPLGFRVSSCAEPPGDLFGPSLISGMSQKSNCWKLSRLLGMQNSHC